jgi:Mrp family chromosome partitioning ATPase
MMPAGQWDRELTKALATDQVEKLFATLRQEYDFVVVDSHPVLPATDALLIGQHVDAVLLALLRDVSQLPRVYAACQRLTGLGIRVLGAVVNGVPATEMYTSNYPSRARAA